MKDSLSKYIGILLLLFFVQGNAQVSFEDAYPNITFNFPVEIQHSIDNSNRMFVVEQPGIIKVFPNNKLVSANQVSTFLDISSIVSYSAGQEIGLLGLAFHPNYNSNGYVYLYYIDKPGFYRINIARYQVSSSNPNMLNPNSATIIARFTKNIGNSNHNGGKIAFGPDGFLYASVGDGGGSNDPQKNSQNLNNVFGSILRLDVDIDGSNPIENNPDLPNGNYEIPSTNPRVGQSGLDELYAWGVRNTWKFSFDKSGNLLGADVGQDAYEEINLITRGGNYGWNRFEGNSQPDYGTGTNLVSQDTKPIFVNDHSAQDRSITGGYVYRGSLSNNRLKDKYIYGDFGSGRVWALTYNPSNGSTSRDLLFDTNGKSISSFGEDEAGELYFCDYGQATKIYKLSEESTGPVTTNIEGIGEWQSISSGTNGIIQTLSKSNNETVYIGGEFTTAGGLSYTNLAVLNSENQWQSFSTGSNGVIHSIETANNGNLYVAGSFNNIGGVSANNIAVWNGTNWSALGSGTNGPISNIKFNSSGALFVCGSYSIAGGITTEHIAKWENNTWSALTDSSTGISGTNNDIRSIAIENNIIYVGGNFDTAGGKPATRIASWNGSSWSALGSGTSGYVETLESVGNYLYAGGNFVLTGNQTVNRIARFNKNTQTWEALGAGLSGTVNTIKANGSYIYVGGTFNTASDNGNINKVVNNIARWSNGKGWEALGTNTNVGVNTRVNSMKFIKNNSELLVGGNFSTAGNLNANNIAVWSEVFCADDNIIPEYKVNGSWDNGSNNLNFNEGDQVILSMLPNTTSFTITLPNGNVVNQDYSLGSTTPGQSGIYTITTSQGCVETITITINSTIDDDNDGIANSSDNCPNTPNGQSVNASGCSSSQLDDDSDGVYNNIDNCPNTPPGETVNSNGCSNSELDDDNDGVFNNLDNCPNTPSDTNVDTNGCTITTTIDTDNDGVIDANDNCPNTPNGETVNSNGCSDSQIVSCSDDSIIPEYRVNGNWINGNNTPTFTVGDEVILSILPNSTVYTITLPNGNIVNNDYSLGNIDGSKSGDYTFTTKEGCTETISISVSQDIDQDNDGIENSFDNCPNTPSGETVNSNGCSSSQLDDDNDGVFNNEDNCPNTPSGESVSTNGCSSSQLDDDNDGVFNNTDNCPNTPAGSNVDTNGCPVTNTTDTDNDGVIDTNDNCPDTPNGEIVNSNGCSSSQLANCSDDSITPEYRVNGNWINGNNTPTFTVGDEVILSILPNTTIYTITLPNGSIVNNDYSLGSIDATKAGNYIITTEEGCTETISISVNQDTDEDNDGITNSKDNCPNTPNGETVNSNGCSDSQLDDDNDGVFNNADQCPNTTSGSIVDINGCQVTSTADADNDGVPDNEDKCPNTLNGESVDENGCSNSQLDDDNDGVPDNEDQCPNTTSGSIVDINGCQVTSTTDADNDGVPDNEDNCPNTPNGESVDENGCIITNIPADFYTISSIGNSCINSDNGSINIVAKTTGNYSATLSNGSTNSSYNFSITATISNLATGKYDLCIISDEFPNTSFCSKVNITEPDALSVQAELNALTNSVTLKMNGSKSYTVDINGKSTRTELNEINIPLIDEVNIIKVLSDKLCQGTFEKTIVLENSFVIYPNPADKRINIDISFLTGEWVEISLYSESGNLLQVSTHQKEESLVTLYIEHLSSGIYILRMKNAAIDKSFKIVKP